MSFILYPFFICTYTIIYLPKCSYIFNRPYGWIAPLTWHWHYPPSVPINWKKYSEETDYKYMGTRIIVTEKKYKSVAWLVSNCATGLFLSFLSIFFFNIIIYTYHTVYFSLQKVTEKTMSKNWRNIFLFTFMDVVENSHVQKMMLVREQTKTTYIKVVLI